MSITPCTTVWHPPVVAHLAEDANLCLLQPTSGWMSPAHASGYAGCHPAGSVVGCAGHNAAAQAVRDLGLQPCWATA